MQANALTGKCVIVIDGSLPLGLMLNTAAALGVSIGAKLENILGPDAMDRSHQNHVGLIQMGLPILKATAPMLQKLRDAAALIPDLLLVDFSQEAQVAKSRDEYLEAIREKQSSEILYLGLALYGDRRKVSSMTGSLPLIR
jgi:Protein of unknown function (DUF2000)